MKKNYIFVILFALTTSVVFSQPTITHSGNAPQIGDVYYFSNTDDPIDPGPSGANQSWDFSNINISSTDQATILAPGGTPFAGDFPECNQVFHYDGTGTYIYYDLTQSEMNHYGEGFDDNTQLVIHFSDPSKEIEYPFAYNNSFTDSFLGSYDYEGLTTHTSGTSTVTADAWGSVTTPEDTYNSVLRVKSVRSVTDSVWMADIFVYTTTTIFTDYSWHTSSSHTPVMSITVIDTDMFSDTVAHYTTSSQHVYNPNDGISALSVQPNPASNFVKVSFNTPENMTVQLAIVDLTGKLIVNREYALNQPGSQEVDLNLDGIRSGLYFIKITSGNQIQTKKLIVR